MIEFIKSYGIYIICALISIVELIFFFIRKKPQLNLMDRLTSDIDDVLPGFIQLAEQTGLSGQDKMAFVVSSCIERLKHIVSSIDEIYWSKLIVSKTEAILACPQKKEKIDEKI